MRLLLRVVLDPPLEPRGFFRPAFQQRLRGARRLQEAGGFALGGPLGALIGAGIGLTLALVLMAGLREEADLASIPNTVKGVAMSFFIAGILSMAFMGFAGLFSSS